MMGEYNSKILPEVAKQVKQQIRLLYRTIVFLGVRSEMAQHIVLSGSIREILVAEYDTKERRLAALDRIVEAARIALEHEPERL